MSAPRLSLAVDALQALPFSERMRAYADFDRAIADWSIARFSKRNGVWSWRLDMRSALRAWRHYKAAVRKAQAWRIAA